MNKKFSGSEAFAAAAAAPSSRPVSIFTQLGHCLLLALLASASYWFVSHYVLQTVQVVGPSMIPTMHHADHYFLNRLAYHMQAPRPGDIVVVRDPTDGAYVVKRIIGTPGDSIYFHDGRVYVNGRRLNEPYLSPGMATFTGTNVSEELVQCGKDQYFIMGDNRGNSFDSRMYGPVTRHSILGVIMR